MTVYSQRDPRWADEKIGNSNSSIGDYGCTITALGMLADLNPSEVNERLTNVGGYLGDLILWRKINAAIPWLEWEWRGYTYENDKVLAAIAENGACMVEVNAARIGTTKHWVLYIGNQKMLDPWYGNEKSTSYYAPIGYSVIKVIGEKPEGDMSEALEACMKDREKFWKERDDALEELSECRDECLMLSDSKQEQQDYYEQELADTAEQMEDLENQIQAQKAEIIDLNAEIEKLKSDNPLEGYTGIELIVAGIKKLIPGAK